MPIANQAILASGAVVAVSVALAAALAVYEHPELRRYTEDVRRRIALALHTLGDGLSPPQGEPRFNRPEDADGFFESANGRGAEPGVDADEETRRRQREELMYWNSVRLQKQQEQGANETKGETEQTERLPIRSRGSSFDDFLRQDETAENGAYVFNSGADYHVEASGLRHRGETAQQTPAYTYLNPFADEHHLDHSDYEDAARPRTAHPEVAASDIYSATTREYEDAEDVEDAPIAMDLPVESLIDVQSVPEQANTESSATLERDLEPNEYVTAGQPDQQDAYASIQAWAQDSSRNFYSPLPVTPVAPVSEPEVLSTGELTPTDTMSLAGSGEDVGRDAQSSKDGEQGRPFDVISESDGMMTPASWSEVGSVISDNEGPMHA